MPNYFTKVVIDIETNHVDEKIGGGWQGKWALCKGASSEQKQLEQEQAAFYNTLTKDYSIQFAKQSAIMDSLTKAFGPILAAGPDQYGFTGAEDTALRTQASEGTAKNYSDAAKAVNSQLAAQGGGDAFLPSGAAAQLKEQVAASGAAQESAAQLGITQSGYERGYQKFLNAANALSGNASMYSPVSYAGVGNTAGENAFSSATKIQEMENQGGFMGALGGILGGGLSAFAGGFGGGLGSAVGKSMGQGGCWIAAEIFDGWNDVRTHEVRQWIFGEFVKHWYGRIAAKLYLKFGERLAAQIHERRWLRKIFEPIFFKALEKARALR